MADFFVRYFLLLGHLLPRCSFLPSCLGEAARDYLSHSTCWYVESLLGFVCHALQRLGTLSLGISLSSCGFSSPGQIMPTFRMGWFLVSPGALRLLCLPFSYLAFPSNQRLCPVTCLQAYKLHIAPLSVPSLPHLFLSSLRIVWFLPRPWHVGFGVLLWRWALMLCFSGRTLRGVS